MRVRFSDSDVEELVVIDDHMLALAAGVAFDLIENSTASPVMLFGLG